MAKRKQTKSEQFIDLLSAELPIDDDYLMPEREEPKVPPKDWFPAMGPTGMDFFFDDTKYLLAHGERGSGKTFACLHKLVKHLYDHDGASACITVVTRSSAILGGSWTKLQKVLQIWRDGLGLEGEGKNGEFMFKMDDGRNRYTWIKNRHGGWSMCFLRSMQHADQIKARMKGMEFSFFFFDELTETDDERYFTETIQQLGRLPNIQPQQYVGACNPPDDGEDHWVHKRFFTGFDKPGEKYPKKRKDYKAVHFPMTENTFMTVDQKEEYLANVMEACRNDPTAEARLLHGKWVKKPTGKGLFAEYFRREKHVRGKVETKQFIIPGTNVIDVGYDIGTANTGISFLECHNTARGELWSVFDEIQLIEKYVPIPEIAPMLLAKMNYWCNRTNRPLHFNHISDQASFNQMRPDGTYDARKLEEEIEREMKENADRYPHLKHLIKDDIDGQPNYRIVRLVDCPKPAGSVAARVRMIISRLQGELIIVSARCLKIIDMFENLEQHPDKPYHPRDGSRHRHPLDSTSYVIYHYEMGGRSGVPSTGQSANLIALRV